MAISQFHVPWSFGQGVTVGKVEERPAPVKCSVNEGAGRSLGPFVDRGAQEPTHMGGLAHATAYSITRLDFVHARSHRNVSVAQLHSLHTAPRRPKVMEDSPWPAMAAKRFSEVCALYSSQEGRTTHVVGRATAAQGRTRLPATRDASTSPGSLVLRWHTGWQGGS